VIASIGATADGRLLNINADTFAAHLAGAWRAARLLIAGATPGVLDAAGRTIPCLDVEAIDGLVMGGQAHSGMVAKLAACRQAWLAGVHDVRIFDAREALAFDGAGGTVLTGPDVAAAEEAVAVDAAVGADAALAAEAASPASSGGKRR
jgi:acetylglutamate kinase